MWGFRRIAETDPFCLFVVKSLQKRLILVTMGVPQLRPLPDSAIYAWSQPEVHARLHVEGGYRPDRPHRPDRAETERTQPNPIGRSNIELDQIGQNVDRPRQNDRTIGRSDNAIGK